MRNTNPAGTVLVLLSFPIPMELNFHPPMLIRINLLAPGADHDGGLAPLNKRLRGHSRRPERNRIRNAFEAVSIGQFFSRTRANAIRTAFCSAVTNRGEQISLVQIFTIVILQRELESAGKRPARAGPAMDLDPRSLFLQTNL